MLRQWFTIKESVMFDPFGAFDWDSELSKGIVSELLKRLHLLCVL